MSTEIRLRIVLLSPPPGVDFALQHGRGSNAQPVQTQRSASADLQFDFTAKLNAKATPDVGEPDFLGPFVQGAAGVRFVYIGIGRAIGQSDTDWDRRLKVPLSGITWGTVARLQSEPPLILETRVPGTGRDGGPNCATVKPFGGWQAVERR